VNRKLQVFISSTYEDLKDERQAAVQAVLDAGHIPAGMELFAAGDKSQWESITRWIDESDAFLLILGGRYGSIEPESKKAYVELEYRYAMEKGKRLFALVLKEELIQKKVAQLGTKVIEQSDPRWKEFHTLVIGKLCSFVADNKDIWIAIHKSMKEIERDGHLGWVRAVEVPESAKVVAELASLTKENKELRLKIAAFEKDSPRDPSQERELKFRGISEKLLKLTESYGNKSLSMLNVFLANRKKFINGVNNHYASNEAMKFLYFQAAPHLKLYGLLEDFKSPGAKHGILRTSKFGNDYLQWAVEQFWDDLKPDASTSVVDVKPNKSRSA